MRMLKVGAVFTVTAALTRRLAAQQKPKELQWTHAFDLSCRQATARRSSPRTRQKFGVEAFKDNNNDLGVCTSPRPAPSPSASGFQDLKVPLRTARAPTGSPASTCPLARPARRSSRKDTKVHSMEVFRDPNTDNWLYITEKGNLAATAGKRQAARPATRRPSGSTASICDVRKGGVKDWKDAAKFGIEVYRDGNTGNLIYISETGPSPSSPRPPTPSDRRRQGPRMAARPRPRLPQVQRAELHQGHAQVRRRGLPRREQRQPHLHQRDRQPRRHRRRRRPSRPRRRATSRSRSGRTA